MTSPNNATPASYEGRAHASERSECGDEAGENEHFRRAGGVLLRLAGSSGLLASREVLIAQSLFELTAESLERLGRSARSLEGRKELLRTFANWQRVLRKLRERERERDR